MSDLPARYRQQLLEAARVAQEAGVRDPASLADALYDRWYAPPRGRVREFLPPPAVALHLRASDAAGTRFGHGWTVLAHDEAQGLLGPPRSSWQIPAARGTEARWVDPADVLYDGHIGLRPPPGMPVAVSARRDALTEPHGWWTVFAETWPQAAQPLLRLYWSVPPERLFVLVSALTGGLAAGAPWALKCPLQLERCCRPDAVVLYLPTKAWPLLRRSVANVYGAARDVLAPDVPALTLELAPGLALAEDPGGQSFGTARCQAVAEGMASAFAGGLPDEAALAAAAERALDELGVSPPTPYMNPGSQESYEWPPA